jgi:hypothetical protein
MEENVGHLVAPWPPSTLDLGTLSIAALYFNPIRYKETSSKKKLLGAVPLSLPKIIAGKRTVQKSTLLATLKTETSVMIFRALLTNHPQWLRRAGTSAQKAEHF